MYTKNNICGFPINSKKKYNLDGIYDKYYHSIMCNRDDNICVYLLEKHVDVN